MGDLKLVERPQNHTLGPGASKTVRANIKVPLTTKLDLLGGCSAAATQRLTSQLHAALDGPRQLGERKCA